MPRGQPVSSACAISSRRIIRQWSVNQFSTFFTPANMLNMFDYYRFYRRHINRLMTQRFFVAFFNILTTASSGMRLMRDKLCDFLWRKLLTHVRFVPFLCSAFPANFTSFSGFGNFRSVRRRRFRRILRIYSQQSFKLLDASFKRCNFIFQLLYVILS